MIYLKLFSEDSVLVVSELCVAVGTDGVGDGVLFGCG